MIFKPSSGIVDLLCFRKRYRYSSWPQDIIKFEIPQFFSYIPYFVLKRKKLILRSSFHSIVKFLLESRILSIGISLKAVLPIDDILGPFTAHGEGVSHHSPLWLSVKGHHLPQVMNQSDQMQPIQIRKLGTSTLCSLECMNDIRQLRIRITFVHQVVEFLQRLPDRGLELWKTQPFLVATFKREIFDYISTISGVTRIDAPVTLYLIPFCYWLAKAQRCHWPTSPEKMCQFIVTLQTTFSYLWRNPPSGSSASADRCGERAPSADPCRPLNSPWTWSCRRI